MKNIKNVLWGLLLIAAGVIVGLNTFEIMEINMVTNSLLFFTFHCMCHMILPKT